ncbi:MAG: DNA polymerase III subunit alpha, partial [Herpetosiphonaceae bacterium]|nr:DNA polymerase III subunit alpha [Herpetosiphonaceae bacterium]
PEHYFLELQLHPEVPELHEINEELVRISRELGIPLVATNDAHFVDQQDADTHRMLRCMGFNTTVAEYCSKNPELDDSYFLRSPAQMEELMSAYPREAIDNTRRIADMCNLELEFGRVQLPEFPLPEGHTPSSYLRELSDEGLVRRLGNPPKLYWERLAYELDVIDQTGFPLYMLIVWDFVKFARTQSIPCLPRGSAGGSLVLYCLGITDVDPVANKLVFERFLNPERKEMPDIDMDFADSRRAEVINYVAGKYGRDRTAQIITFGTLGAKAALRDVGRVLSIPLSTVDQVAKLVPKLPVGTTLTQSLERVPDLKKMYDGDAQIKDLIDRARRLEGVTRNVGTHACGVVVSAQPLEEIVPLQHTARDEEAVMASFPMGTLGDIGLLKMDMLGLTNLSIVDAALQYISQEQGKPFTLADVPSDDKATLEMLSQGNTLGVFQFESPPMVRYLRELKPSRIEDIYAMVALYRPGPMEQLPLYIEWKNHPQRITYLHPVLKPILEDTYGIIVYQEQVLGILMQMAGYTMGKADIVRKAIGKKNRELMAKEEPRFIEGCVQNGLNAEQANKLWSLIQPFAGYSFNRAHATLYGLLSYQTAYLKTHYPTEYMAALLSSSSGSLEDTARYVGEASRLGVAVLPPDVNHSKHGFSIEALPEPLPPGVVHHKGVRFGLGAIKSVGEGPVEAICAVRDEGGPFTSIDNLAERIDRREVTKRVFEALIKCGAMPDFGGTRRQLLGVLDQVVARAAEGQRMRDAGQASMFDLFGGNEGPAVANSTSFPPQQDTAEDQKQYLLWEKELLGMYISDHPIAQALSSLPPDPNRLTLGALSEAHIGQKVTLIGMLTGLRRLMTKKGDAMLSAQFEDLESTIDVVAFPRIYEKFSAFWQEDNIVALTGKVDHRREALQIIIDSVAPFTEAPVVAPVALAEQSLGYLPDDLPGYVDVDSTMVDDDTWRASLPTSGGVTSLIIPSPMATNGNGSMQGHTNGQEGEQVDVPTNVAKDGERETTPDGPPMAKQPPVQREERVIARGDGAEVSAPPAPPASPAVTVLRPRQRITIAKKDGQGGGGGTQPPQVGTAGSGPQYHLHLHLARTGDDDADIHAMQTVHKLLCRYTGQHNVTIYVPKDANWVLLQPMGRIDPNPELLKGLTELLGEEAVLLEGGK